MARGRRAARGSAGEGRGARARRAEPNCKKRQGRRSARAQRASPHDSAWIMPPLTCGSLNLSKASQFGSALRALALRIYPFRRQSLPHQPFTAAERRLRQSNPAIYGAFRIFARNSLQKIETIPKLAGFDRQARRPGQPTFANSFAVFSLRKNNNHTNSNYIETHI